MSTFWETCNITQLEDVSSLCVCTARLHEYFERKEEAAVLSSPQNMHTHLCLGKIAYSTAHCSTKT
jgi:hypothetical protein